MKNILVVEDSIPLLLDIRMMLEEEFGIECDTASNFSEAVTLLKQTTYDLILADIYLDLDFKIFDVFDQVKVKSPIIFITSSEEIDIYEKTETYDSFLFLVKPFSMLSLKSAVSKFFKKSDESPNSRSVFFKHRKRNIAIPIENIQYINTDGNYCNVNTVNEKIFVRSTLDKLIRNIDDPDIVRIHRQYGVNIAKVDEVNFAQSYVIINENEFPIGRKYKKDLVKLVKM